MTHSEEVVITLYDPLHGERRYVFHEPDRCVVGRADDCDIRVDSDSTHMEVSRHHCMLEIDPPRVFITDVGSTNGTFVNGVNIGKRRSERMAIKTATVALNDGDQIHLGRAALWLFVESRSPQLQSV